MEGSETYAYRFLKHCMETQTMAFRARDVKEWLKTIKYDRRVYDAQVHKNILKPLLAKGFIRKEKTRYEIDIVALDYIETLRRKKSGPQAEEKQKEILIPANAIMPETHKEEDHDEWDAYVASRLKKSAKEP